MSGEPRAILHVDLDAFFAAVEQRVFDRTAAAQGVRLLVLPDLAGAETRAVTSAPPSARTVASSTSG